MKTSVNLIDARVAWDLLHRTIAPLESHPITPVFKVYKPFPSGTRCICSNLIGKHNRPLLIVYANRKHSDEPVETILLMYGTQMFGHDCSGDQKASRYYLLFINRTFTNYVPNPYVTWIWPKSICYMDLAKIRSMLR